MSVRGSTSAPSASAPATCRAGSPTRLRLRQLCAAVRAASTFEMPKSSTFTSGRAADAASQKEVRRLQIAMDDAERVRLAMRLARLDDVVHAPPRWSAPRSSRTCGEIAPVQVLHHDVGRARLERPDVETRATCSLWRRTAACASRRKRSATSSGRGRAREQELERHELRRAARCVAPRRRPPFPPRLGRARPGTCRQGCPLRRRERCSRRFAWEGSRRCSRQTYVWAHRSLSGRPPGGMLAGAGAQGPFKSRRRVLPPRGARNPRA